MAQHRLCRARFTGLPSLVSRLATYSPLIQMLDPTPARWPNGPAAVRGISSSPFAVRSFFIVPLSLRSTDGLFTCAVILTRGSECGRWAVSHIHGHFVVPVPRFRCRLRHYDLGPRAVDGVERKAESAGLLLRRCEAACLGNLR